MLERKLTIAVVFAVFLETAGVLLWAGAASERLKEVEMRVAQQAPLAERLARVEAHLQTQSAQLDRIESKMEARR